MPTPSQGDRRGTSGIPNSENDDGRAAVGAIGVRGVRGVRRAGAKATCGQRQNSALGNRGPVCASSGDVDAFKGSSVDELRTYLTAHGVDATRWGGQTSSKSLTCLLGEILAGETLIECVDGEPVRRVSVISVEIKNKQGQRLVETEQRLPTGVVRQRHLLLSEKLLPNESWTAASRRGIQEELGSVLPPDARIDVMDDTYEQRTETRLSGSYPGLKTQYQCHKVEARVSGLPDGPFVTTEQRADGLLQSSWSWI